MADTGANCDEYSVGAIYPWASSLGVILSTLASIGAPQTSSVVSQAEMCCGAFPIPPVTVNYRITQSGNRRITMGGNPRITQP